jgi:hypothetical protein
MGDILEYVALATAIGTLSGVILMGAYMFYHDVVKGD